MAAVEVNILSIARAFDELSSPIERLLRHPSDKVDGEKQTTTRFALDDDFFYHVQTYVKTSMEFPDKEDLFKMVHPPTYFKTWLQEDVEYRKMWQSITVVSQHCRPFITHHIAGYASDAVEILKTLAESLIIISDRTIPFSSGEAENARDNVMGLLELLRDNSRETSRRVTPILKAIETFATTTLEDEVVLKALDELLSNPVPEDADFGDWQKQEALQTIQKITALASSNKAVHAHISAMRKALTDIHDALVLMDTTTATMVKAVSLLDAQVRPERADYWMVGTKLDKAVGICKQVVQLSREFAKQASRS